MISSSVDLYARLTRFLQNILTHYIKRNYRFANTVTNNTSRHAWRDLWIQFPNQHDGHFAKDLRKLRQAKKDLLWMLVSATQMTSTNYSYNPIFLSLINAMYGQILSLINGLNHYRFPLRDRTIAPKQLYFLASNHGDYRLPSRLPFGGLESFQ